MAAISGTDLALTTARVGAARVGSFRVGFIPCAVTGPGSPWFGEYIWDELKPPTTQWTLLTEDCVCGQNPEASFSNVLCNAVGPVTFTDTSTPADEITSWYWDFGDGGTSTDQNPTHVYAEGFFTVTLYVSGDKGTGSATGYVSVMSLSAAAAPNPANMDDAVTFTPTLAGGLAPYTYLWDFGDLLPSIITADLYGYWPLDEASGNPRASTLGTAPDLEEVGGAITEVAGRFSNAASSTEAETQELSATLNPPLGVSGGLTIAFWFKLAAYSSGSPSTLLALSNVPWGATPPSLMVYRYYDSDYLDVYFAWAAGNAIALPVTRLGNFTVGDWHLLVVTYDPTTGTLTGRVDDGVMSSAQLWTTVPLPCDKLEAVVPAAKLVAANTSTFDTLKILKALTGVNFAGALDDLRIWTTVLTDDQIADLWYRSDEEIPVYSYGEGGAVVASLTVTSATGCTVTDTVDVTVSDLAVTVAAAQIEGGIDGDAIVEFDYTVTGGTAPYTYLLEWTGGGDGGPDVQENPTITFFGGVPGAPDTIPFTLTVTDDALVTAVFSGSVDITYWDAP